VFTKVFARIGTGVLIAGVVASAGLSAGQSQAADEATIYIIQGLPGKTVEVSVDGKTLARDVKTAGVVGPFKVRAGSRTLTFTDGGSTLDEKKVSLKAGSSTDLVLHLPVSASDDPMVTAFKNDLAAVPKGKAAVSVAHTAAVPPADIRVDGKVLFANVANGESLYLVVPVGTYSVDIVPAGETKPVVLGPLDLAVKGGSLNRVYAVGDPSSKTMNVAVHVISTPAMGSERPADVNTGTGGQAADLDAVFEHFGRSR